MIFKKLNVANKKIDGIFYDTGVLCNGALNT